MKKIIIIIIYSVTLSCNNTDSSYEPLPEKIDFNFHVRPILVQNCYLCHGPDPSSRKANLRLDTQEGLTAALESGGFAVVPGKPDESNLIDRINNLHEDKIMPPPESNNKLTKREKDILGKWIEQGAKWKTHWAFIQPSPNKKKNQITTIDLFIDKQLDQKNLKKTSIANKNTLIRRVSYLLTGLPPLTEDVENFIADSSVDAYQKMVDKYLNSPAYGERWARHWMDLVRYAETKGHEFDFIITGAWKYRDYLIRAFNNDVPYNQILKEHLAGDLLENKRYNTKEGILESPIATNFYTLGEGAHSPVDIRQDEANRIDNMIDVITKSFQGLTVSCAKCHDHKFDPITAKDYYALYGIMESTRFTPLDSDLTIEKVNTAKEIQEIQSYITSLVGQKIQLKKSTHQVKINPPHRYKMIGDFRNHDLEDWQTSGYAFGDRTTLANPTLSKTSGKLMALDYGKASSRLYGEGFFGALRSPNFTLDSDFIGVRARGKKSTIRIIIDNFQLISNPIYGDLSKRVNQPNWKNYTFDVSAWKGHKAYVEIITGEYQKHDFKLSEDSYVEAEYSISYDSKWPSEVRTTQNYKSQIKELNTKLKTGELSVYYPELIKLNDRIKKLTKGQKSTSFINGVSDGFAINSPVFNRGNYQERSAENIPRRFLSVLSPGGKSFQSQGSGRLELAEAMLSEENPLTSRVMVNRIWHHLFGRGIVETVDNFGLQGKLPSHPELLDHLAIKFQKEGWSIKKMIKYILSSDTFKRSSLRDEELLKKDPNNIYLASFPFRRLEAEAIRDGILVASESLDTSLYGAPIPIYLTEFMQGRGKPEKSGPLNGNRRRSIYLEVRRNFLEPMMTTFDRPIPFSTVGKRDVTNVPSQSLILMNDPFVIGQAEIMAKKLLEQKQLSFDQKIEWVYMHSFSRKPSKDEIKNAKKFISQLKEMENIEDESLTPWIDYCHSIFNLKEFIYLM